MSISVLEKLDIVQVFSGNIGSRYVLEILWDSRRVEVVLFVGGKKFAAVGCQLLVDC